jgi:hypothetical protein
MTERAQVLEMLANGKITPEQGAQLLGALAPDRTPAPAPVAAPVFAGRDEQPKSVHWLHVRVSDMGSGRVKVNLTIPLALMKLGLQIGSRFSPEVAELDADELVNALRGVTAGPLVDVQDEEDGEHVEIFVD